MAKPKIFSSGIGKRLRMVRERLGYTRMEMAQVMGLHVSGYYKNEKR